MTDNTPVEAEAPDTTTPSPDNPVESIPAPDLPAELPDQGEDTPQDDEEDD